MALKRATGQPSRLSPQQKIKLKKYVLDHAVKVKGGRLMGKDIQKYVQETFEVNYCVRNIYRLMKALDIVWITSRSKHPKQDLVAQEAFKKILN